jgi:polyhydroxyalkanoate synthesis regulator phasin
MQEQLRGMDGAQWKALVASPDTEELRARIRALEQRLADLEKKIQQK